MSRRSQTSLAVLGALSTGAMTGYELRAAIVEVLGHFWRESYGQIYPTLADLEAEGAVRREAPGRTSGTTFAITDAGLELFRALLAERHTPQQPRNGLLLRLFFGTHLPPGRAEELLEEVERQCREALDGYAEVRAEAAAEPDTPEQAHRLMTLSFGEHVAAAQLAWARESLAVVRSGSDPSARPRRRR